MPGPRNCQFWQSWESLRFSLPLVYALSYCYVWFLASRRIDRWSICCARYYSSTKVHFSLYSASLRVVLVHRSRRPSRAWATSPAWLTYCFLNLKAMSERGLKWCPLCGFACYFLMFYSLRSLCSLYLCHGVQAPQSLGRRSCSKIQILASYVQYLSMPVGWVSQGGLPIHFW